MDSFPPCSRVRVYLGNGFLHSSEEGGYAITLYCGFPQPWSCIMLVSLSSHVSIFHSRNHIVFRSAASRLFFMVMCSSINSNNSLPSVFLASFNLPSFKRQAHHHCRDQMTWFLFPVTLFKYFIHLFYSFHCLSFPFLKGFRHEKGHIVPVLWFHSFFFSN